MHRRTRAWWGVIVAPLIVVSMGGCSSCKKKPQDELKKDEGKKKHVLDEVPMPADLALELVIKDPDAAVKRGADAAGYGTTVGDSPYAKAIELVPDEDAKRLLRAFDPHGAAALVVTAKAKALLDIDHWSSDTVQVAAAAHLKDAELARTALDAAAKSKGTKSSPAAAFEGTIYELDSDSAVALSGDLLLFGDGVAALEKCGKYTSYLARKGDSQEHDLSLRIPLDALEQEVRKTAPDAWAKAKPDVPPSIAAEIDPLVPVLVDAFTDAGDATMWLDVQGKNIVSEQSMSAHAKLSTFFAGYPAGDASALLAMPASAQSVVLYRWADGLGPLTYVSLDYVTADAVKRGDLTAAQGADLQKAYRALGGAVGHEVVYASRTPPGGFASVFAYGGGGGLEYVARVELLDPGTAKSAIGTMLTLAETEAKKPPSPMKFTVTPYKKASAEGETITIPASTSTYAPSHSDSTFLWAIRGSYLFLDVCVYCTPALLDDAIDPASTKTLATDATAKAKIASFPSKGIVEAGYGDMGAYAASLSMLLGGPTTKSGGATWGWSTVSSDGLHAHEEIPAADVANLVAGYIRLFSGAGYGGYGTYPSPMGTYPSPMGTPPPPAPGGMFK